MRGDALQQCARERADELPGAELGHPFGPEWDVYKVRGKVFMLFTELDGELVVTVKVDPADGTTLRNQHPNITAGYHMNKRHWITVHPADSLTTDLVEDLVTESYLLVVEKLPRAVRPVDPYTFSGGLA